MLCEADIRYLLELLAEKTVVKPTPEFPFRVSRKVTGYSDDPTIGKIQAALSILLEVATRKSR